MQDVGEECEQLLVEAGRKYRLALSMDRTDMRALYNWGLALCYRGQLIAEEGGEVNHPFIASMNSNSSSPLAVGSTICAGVTLICRRFYLHVRYSRRGCFNRRPRSLGHRVTCLTMCYLDSPPHFSVFYTLQTAAQDADKVFLAAIDKFEAMIGLSDTYAAGGKYLRSCHELNPQSRLSQNDLQSSFLESINEQT